MTDADFDLASYDYRLPPDLIAERPAPERSRARLMVYDAKADRTEHAHFFELDRFLPKDSVLVLNDSRVLPARLTGRKATGGKAEMLVLETQGTHCRALLRCAGNKAAGTEIIVPGGFTARVTGREDDVFSLSFDAPAAEVLEAVGQVPIPPYIRGGRADARDAADYQTLFAGEPGSLAAPTAGLHFDRTVFARLSAAGLDTAFVTLHVGAGTFAPVRTEDVRRHRMHRETFFVDHENARKIRRGRPLIAVGTTSLRVLESLYVPGEGIVVRPGERYGTDIFIRPGLPVRSAAGLVTNFHLPRSTLLMLVAALIGRQKTLALYAEAVRLGYRFYSYGDAMLVLP